MSFAMDTPRRMLDLAEFLSSPPVASLFTIHPNQLSAPTFRPPSEGFSWWTWAATHVHPTPPWRVLLDFYNFCCARGSLDDKQDVDGRNPFSEIPPELRTMIAEASRLALPREQGKVYPGEETGPAQSVEGATRRAVPGMSPKKAHEVICMSTYIARLLSEMPSLSHIKHVVDVGAGQAYLSRALRDEIGLHVLALDWSDVQTEGAQKRDAPKKRKGPMTVASDSSSTTLGPREGTGAVSVALGDNTRAGTLTYVTTNITAERLVDEIDQWMKSEDQADGTPADDTPVLLVALHACGSLTPNILRAFLAARDRGSGVAWRPQGAVIVGCCYNMMDTSDFPLSRTLKCDKRTPPLSASHLQLAAQVPAQWRRTAEACAESELALRKVVYRARLEPIIAGGDRLGRLNDTAYADWATFLERAGSRLRLRHSELGAVSSSEPALEDRIRTLQVLRCILGPVVESLILLDRLAWLQEEMEGMPGIEVRLANLFDQGCGSGRNVAIVVSAC